jgi:hypothetical protein
MDVEQPRISRRSKRVDAQASRLLARGHDDVLDGVRDLARMTGARVKSGEDEQLHLRAAKGASGRAYRPSERPRNVSEVPPLNHSTPRGGREMIESAW